MATELKKFEYQDRIPITLAVLAMVEFHYVWVTIQHRVEHEFPDLKKFIQTNCVEQVYVDLINSVRNDIADVTSYSINSLTMTIRSVANVYGIELTEGISEKRLSDIASDFYWSLVIDDFPRHNETDEEGITQPPGRLELFAQSIVPVIYTLCCLLRTGEVDLDFDWEADLSFLSFMYEDYSDEEHVFALRELQDLASVMYQNYFKMLRIVNLKKEKA